MWTVAIIEFDSIHRSMLHTFHTSFISKKQENLKVDNLRLISIFYRQKQICCNKTKAVKFKMKRSAIQFDESLRSYFSLLSDPFPHLHCFAFPFDIFVTFLPQCSSCNCHRHDYIYRYFICFYIGSSNAKIFQPC